MSDAPVNDEPGETIVGPGAVVGFVGLGNMGSPMAGRLAGRGYVVRGYDVSPEARALLAESTGATVVETVAEVADGADAVVLMLPNSAVVHSVLFDAGLLDRMAPDTVLIDMGSSEPLRTRELARTAADRGVPVVDAPVSGGVRGARDGSLTIMAGGPPEAVAAVYAMLGILGGKILHVGPAGAGHALKALNNLLSATHLLATSEAMLAGQEFGLDPAVMLEAINGSSGRSGSTETKWPRFILDRGFDSGFGLRLMLKDMRIAVGLADATGRPSRLGEAAVELWAHAAERLPAEADHTEIVRWLEAEGEKADD
ncbi:NAD(P)-dependent oxidoreductase [Nonomuraea sp. NPDC049714]|uniref:NAD(P)-dependent oxidoreductase n=1 Tax=Nonomuraea sp. NPDC049714 TaxID=3364357 RepID=UPI0037B8A0C5